MNRSFAHKTAFLSLLILVLCFHTVINGHSDPKHDKPAWVNSFTGCDEKTVTCVVTGNSKIHAVALALAELGLVLETKMDSFTSMGKDGDFERIKSSASKTFGKIRMSTKKIMIRRSDKAPEETVLFTVSMNTPNGFILIKENSEYVKDGEFSHSYSVEAENLTIEDMVMELKGLGAAFDFWADADAYAARLQISTDDVSKL